MPLQFAAHPNNAPAIISSALEKLAMFVKHDPKAFTFKAADFSSLGVDTPHVVYELSLDSLLSNGGIETAQPSSTRYLVQCPTGAVAAIEMWPETNNAGNGQHRLGVINLGPFVDNTAKALLKLSADPRVIAGSYEARILRCSAIHLMAIWLKDNRSGDDLFVPLAPAPGGFKAGRIYDAESLLAEALTEAKVRLEPA